MAKSKHAERYGHVPGTSVALLSAPSKMPGYSWSLPAITTCPRAVFGPGAICGESKQHPSCYAKHGFYEMYECVKHAQQTRFEWTRDAIQTATGREEWIQTLARAIDLACQHGETYFRVHDSGDMFNGAYCQCWYFVCHKVSSVKFWIPTRSWQAPHGLPMHDPVMYWLRQLASLPNVTVRPSALRFGEHAPNVVGLHAGTTAERPDIFTARQCPAHEQGNQCGECRTCWDDKHVPVSYRKH